MKLIKNKSTYILPLLVISLIYLGAAHSIQVQLQHQNSNIIQSQEKEISNTNNVNNFNMNIMESNGNNRVSVSKTIRSKIKSKGILNKYSYSDLVNDFNESKCLEKLVKDKFSQKDINAYKLLDKSTLGKEKTLKQKRLRVGLMLICIYYANPSLENLDKNSRNIMDNVNDVYKFKLLGTKPRLGKKCNPVVESLKSICTVGTFCSNNLCELGLKKKDQSCQYNYECDAGMKCDEKNKCVEGAKEYTEDLYKVTKDHFLKIKFVNILDDIVTKDDIKRNIDLNSDLMNTKIESLGKMLLSISKALNNKSPENIYSTRVIDASKDIYKINFSGQGLVLKEENCLESSENNDKKSICMPGTFCSANVKNICELGFKKKQQTCTYSSECGKDLICASNKCEDGKKQTVDKIPTIDKMEKRLSEHLNDKNEFGPTLVRHKSEVGSFYNLKNKSIIQNKNTEDQNVVRDQLLEFILDREKLSIDVIDTTKFNGVFFIKNDEGFISLKKDAPYEDTSNHELMHYVDYLLGIKKKNISFTSALKFENFLSYQILDSKQDYIDNQDLILTNLIESFNLKHYREGYKSDKNIVCEIPTNLMQQKNLKLDNLFDLTKEYLTDYANELKSMSYNKLSEVANYILNRIK